MSMPRVGVIIKVVGSVAPKSQTVVGANRPIGADDFPRTNVSHELINCKVPGSCLSSLEAI